MREFIGQAALLESAEQDPVDGAPGGPVVIPSPIGDQPLTLEFLAEA